jgi:hypothetical protein
MNFDEYGCGARVDRPHHALLGYLHVHVAGRRDAGVA